MAHCQKCNSILQKNELDVCNLCKQENSLTDADKNKVKELLDLLEAETLNDTGVGKLSGGFAKADMFGFDESYVDVELKWGVQNDIENRVNTEQYKINRKTWKMEDC